MKLKADSLHTRAQPAPVSARAMDACSARVRPVDIHLSLLINSPNREPWLTFAMLCAAGRQHRKSEPRFPVMMSNRAAQMASGRPSRPMGPIRHKRADSELTRLAWRMRVAPLPKKTRDETATHSDARVARASMRHEPIARVARVRAAPPRQRHHEGER